MRSDTADLDDVEELLSADRDGLLQAVALAGAQVRAIAEARREGVLDCLAELRPRSLVIVTGASAVGADAVDFVVAAIGARVDVPIVVIPTLPGWIGPLDVVVLAGDDAGDPALIDAGARGARRRAEVVTLAPLEGPLRDAVAGRVIDLSPRVNVPAEFRFCGLVAGLLAVCAALTAVRTTGAVIDFDDLATALDAEAAANHPDREGFRNQAKLLASKVQERETIWAGDDASTDVVARRASVIFATVAAVPGAAVTLPAALGAMLIRSGTGESAADSIFYDPQFDGPIGRMPQLLVVSSAGRHWYTRQRVGDLATEILVDVVDSNDAGDTAVAGRDETMGYLVVTLRMEMAAVYLRLLGAGRA
ncbi:hypothetical protein GOEFS_132_00830 [Gordonia effusa NBRC 100432]|uniref:Bifunctional glucose-6-phosphate/mannose-6-phosphate isomerase C-terminal domain-containing protein n=1 Tax=Gordonia effusa NBRC 100432 TaxID=1077974 RepID=H0R701_9ACTN|nr:hypothetical protein [Gordonia effusa]GAB20852.1 hypothetical protein GOEFS_132_00830 [Gordonia effusa NBRC 100432]